MKSVSSLRLRSVGGDGPTYSDGKYCCTGDDDGDGGGGGGGWGGWGVGGLGAKWMGGREGE